MASQAATEAVAGAAQLLKKAPFKVGKKQLYLPNHIVTLVRPKPGQSPMTAAFHVPLTFTKFDFRDYLFHVYDVEVHSVRSFINQQGLRMRDGTPSHPGQWYRPRSRKMMIVELKKPFVWPERPTTAEDLEPWDNTLFKAVEEGHNASLLMQERSQNGEPPMRANREPEPQRLLLREKAEAILAGKTKWAPGRGWVEVDKEKEKVAAEEDKEKAAAEEKES